MDIVRKSSSDIRARRLVDSKLPHKIIVRIKRTDDADILEVEDNGIGMSMRILTGPLLDFGRSLWRSGLLRQEFPGLLSKGLKTTGRFGIGFFSVFMLGDKVTVTSRRYDLGASETHCLEFQQGLRIRPVVREPNNDEAMLQGGTRISVVLRKRYDEPGGILPKGANDKVSLLDALAKFVARVAPSLDVTISVEANNNSSTAIEADDWIEGTSQKVVERSAGGLSDWRVENAKSIIANLKFLRDSKTGEVHGRACFNVGIRYGTAGVVTVGGFRAADIYEMAGVLKGETNIVTRQSAMPTVPGPILKDWASEQAALIVKSRLPSEQKLRAASLVMLCGGDATKLPIAIQDNAYLTANELQGILEDMAEVEVFEGNEIDYDEDDDVRPSSFRNSFQISSKLILIPKPITSILGVGNLQWPACIPDLYTDGCLKSCQEAFDRILQLAWGTAAEYDEDRLAVGEVEGEDIRRSVRIYSRPIDVSKYLEETSRRSSLRLQLERKGMSYHEVDQILLGSINFTVEPGSFLSRKSTMQKPSSPAFFIGADGYLIPSNRLLSKAALPSSCVGALGL